MYWLSHIVEVQKIGLVKAQARAIINELKKRA